MDSTLLVFFGISIISNGIHPIGAAMHGFNGMGVVFCLLAGLLAAQLMWPKLPSVIA